MDAEHVRFSRRQAVLAGVSALGGLGHGVSGLRHFLAASPRASTDAGNGGDTLAAATREFGFRLLGRLSALQPTTNVVVSPLSVAMALSIIYNGARGETRRALADVLGVQGMSLDTLNRANAVLTAALQSRDLHVRLNVANALWGRRGVTFNPAFVGRVQHFYDARTATLDFADPHAAVAINEWVRQATRGQIKRIVADRIDPRTILFAINAVYFKGPWTTPFNKGRTRPGPFTTAGGARKTLPMMTQQQQLPYYRGPGFAAVALPYGNGALSMYVLLPDRESRLAQLQSMLNAQNWAAWMSRFHAQYGSITLPRFKVDYGETLDKALGALGAGIAFDPLRADLTGIAVEPRPYISALKHGTTLRVDEAGTTAAALTSAEIGATAVMAPSFTMVVDRPFICAVRDGTTGSILFLGAIVDPAQP